MLIDKGKRTKDKGGILLEALLNQLMSALLVVKYMKIIKYVEYVKKRKE